MAAVKPKRHKPSMDMTAMCDVAFLLLTFFIMTSSFRSEEAVSINTPSSVSKLKVEETGIGTVSITPEGKYFFGVTDPIEKRKFLNTLNTNLKLNLTDAEKKSFLEVAEIGVGKERIKSYLSLSKADRERATLPGIPLDSTNTELIDWVRAYAEANPQGQLAIRGDVKTQYPAVKILFDELARIKFYKFRLITKGE
ncbi:ExbD/TolR family protein [Leadbetterella byssophila]|jgi:biopolymer transport protein ExbD|uniref:Biopolymer transport protein ExbD/TolR n=1 Tax=Leadbetterella byssophila (strain DSM 17132 / JCM 16389 / KACC 11308 / NBRC 106382 / 4M15) TaxID=649349 RepID=E4RVW3_LEAB4|nr:biopolymer transporter ExbD [Leadbetterella byssophila]ADQ18873.1 Biopolymer transport protein ExbD/TolR [Leadbetterella byssophila DSM 17132]